MKILGLDFGEKRVGIAISDEMAIIAIPLKAVLRDNSLEEIESIVKEEKIETIVIGFPRQMDGTPSGTSKYIISFVEKLKEILSSAVKIELEDETATSVLAEERLALRKENFRINKELVDIESAVIILQSYLDEKGNK